MGRNLLYLLLLPICLIATWNLFSVGDMTILAGYASYGSLIGALVLSPDVPFWRPRPTVAAAIPMGAWSIGLLHLALSASDGDSITAVILAALVGLLLPLFFGPRLRRFTKTHLWLGFMITAVALCVGTLALPNDGPPQPLKHGIGFSSAITRTQEEKRGLILRLNAFPNTCGDVSAELQVFGTSEFWKHHPAQPGRIPLQVFMPAGSATDVVVFPLTASVTAADAIAPSSNEGSSLPLYRDGRPLHNPARRLPFDAGLTEVSTVGGTDIIDAWVSGDWEEVKAPVIFQFNPDWMVSDGIRSCYLQTPPLVGNDAWPEILSPAWNQIDHEHLVLPSLASTTLYNSPDLGGQSRPEPTATDSESLIWTCGIDGNNVSRRGIDDSLEPYPLNEYEEPAEGDCAEVTRLELGGAKALGDLLIFIVGGLVSLGLTLAFAPASSIGVASSKEGQPRQ